ncbi:hypothetical protein [Coxiella burnetii]|uniref:hypothetical protein n=1 Tax=Coxiella burnetii TaxID=777 RepID=UPI0002DF739D|nr:hypothetical protein [Coxiella burnetii]
MNNQFKTVLCNKDIKQISDFLFLLPLFLVISNETQLLKEQIATVLHSKSPHAIFNIMRWGSTRWSNEINLFLLEEASRIGGGNWVETFSYALLLFPMYFNSIPDLNARNRYRANCIKNIFYYLEVTDTESKAILLKALFSNTDLLHQSFILASEKEASLLFLTLLSVKDLLRQTLQLAHWEFAVPLVNALLHLLNNFPGLSLQSGRGREIKALLLKKALELIVSQRENVSMLAHELLADPQFSNYLQAIFVDPIDQQNYHGIVMSAASFFQPCLPTEGTTTQVPQINSLRSTR